MKFNIFFTFAVVLSFIASCNKPTLWSISDIVETDGQGNVLSSPNGSTDWNPQEGDEFDIFSTYSTILCEKSYESQSGINDCKNFKRCDDSTFLGLIVYPNPVPSGIVPKMELNTSKVIKSYILSMRKAHSNGAVENYSSDELIEGTRDINVDLPDFQLRDGNDMELFITVLFRDSCFLYSRGKVKYL